MEIGIIVLLLLVFAIRFLPLTIQVTWGVTLIAAILFVILKK